MVNSKIAKFTRGPMNVRGQICPATGGASPCDFEPLGTFDDLSGKVGLVEVMQCKRCKQGISLPLISDVSFLYTGRESQDFQQSDTGLAHTIKRIAFGRQVTKLLRQIGHQPAKILDFGCGSGLFTRCLGDKLGADTVTGSDFEATAPLHLANRQYLSMTELDAHQGSYDLVLAMHVLEHDDDPALLLNRIGSMARSGGTIVIEVPNVECFWARVFGKAWDGWYLPYHRTHFSRVALSALAEHEGYVVTAQSDICVPSMGRSFSNLCGGNKGLGWLLVGIVTHPVQWLGELLSGKPSALRIILRKPD